MKHISATNLNNFCEIYHTLRLPDCFLWLTATVDLGAIHLADKATWLSRGHVISQLLRYYFSGHSYLFPSFLTPFLISGETEGGREWKEEEECGANTCRPSGNSCWRPCELVGLLSWNLKKSSLKSDSLILLGLTLLCLPAVDNTGLGSWNNFYCSWTQEGSVSVTAES